MPGGCGPSGVQNGVSRLAAGSTTRADIEALLAGDPEARLSVGWRADLVGERIRRLVAGEAALAFDGTGNLLLEDRIVPS